MTQERNTDLPFVGTSCQEYPAIFREDSTSDIVIKFRRSFNVITVTSCLKPGPTFCLNDKVTF